MPHHLCPSLWWRADASWQSWRSYYGPGRRRGLLLGAWSLTVGLGIERIVCAWQFRAPAYERVLEEHVTFAGAPFWTIRYSFTGFERVTVRHEKFGVFGPRSHFVVVCDGCRRVDLSAFPDRTAAEAFASDIGRQMSLPVVVRSLV